VGTPLKIGGIPHQSRYSWVPERHHGLRGSVVTDLRDLSRRLFAAADQLWTNSDLCSDQYAQPVVALIALRQIEHGS
jgi:type I restriction enzyme M protein